MPQSLESAIALYGAECKVKLASPSIAGEPEDLSANLDLKARYGRINSAFGAAIHNDSCTLASERFGDRIPDSCSTPGNKRQPIG